MAQGTSTITFDGYPPQPPGTSYFAQEYFEAGMWFRPLEVVGPGNGFGRTRGEGQKSDIPDNGTACLDAAFGDSLVFSFVNGSAFNLVSVDLAEYGTLFQAPLTVPFIGYRVDGGTVTTSFITDGIIDGSAPLADFETFYFGPEWSGLTRVEIPTPLWSLDHLVVTVPEPGVSAFLLVGLLAMARRRLVASCVNASATVRPTT